MYPYVFVAGPNKHDTLLIIAWADGTRNSTKEAAQEASADDICRLAEIREPESVSNGHGCGTWSQEKPVKLGEGVDHSTYWWQRSFPVAMLNVIAGFSLPRYYGGARGATTSILLRLLAVNEDGPLG